MKKIVLCNHDLLLLDWALQHHIKSIERIMQDTHDENELSNLEQTKDDLMELKNRIKGE